jgi:uncharacterized alpha-E superfamily protein
VTALLSRHAECAFWLARYLERAESMARILEAHVAFNRGRAIDAPWAWILALYSDEEAFFKKFPEANAENVIHHYVTDLENLSSIQGSVRAARENARALRALLPTDMWLQLNDFYSRLLAFTKSDFSEMRLSRTCDSIKRGCYAEIGVAESTLYRDEGWPFFRLGLFIERADQTSRLLDVQFAQRAAGMAELSPEQEAGFWNVLLRSASAYHAFRRVQPSGLKPDDVARFLIFESRLPRSIAFCAAEICRMISQLRSEFRLRNAHRAFERSDAFLTRLQAYSRDEQLLTRLHAFNDWVQTELMELGAELGTTFFGHQPPAPEPQPLEPPKPLETSSHFQTQAQSSGQFQTQG